jgi:starch-binding outer membrane protein, SusD/RagB family
MKKQYKYSKSLKVLGLLVATGIISCIGSCKKSLDIGPPTTSLATANVYTSNSASEAVISGLYASMANPNKMYNGINSVSILQGLAADELTSFSTSNVFIQFYTNSLTAPLTAQSGYYWAEIFSELFICNSAIQGLGSATSLDPTIQQQLLAEAKFTRAYLLFNAVNLFGDVPLVLSTDPAINNVISRSPAATVLKQVIQDLTAAQSVLPDNKYQTLAGTIATDRLLPNKQAASALLARVYLYMQDWKDAEAQSSNVIGSSIYVLEPNLSNVFLKTSRETIWQLQSISPSVANGDAPQLVLTSAPNGTQNQFPLNAILVNAFENGDARFNSWVGQLKAGTTTYYYAYKYKQNAITSGTTINEYPVLFRLAEQLLIRAEARAQQNNLSGAASDLNTIRARAGLAPTIATTQTDLLNAVYHERQVELFTEFGHRWFDLKRTLRLDPVMIIVDPLKGGTWSSYKQLIPIPQSELNLNSHLIQNPGY